jgi:hypothetical protein
VCAEVLLISEVRSRGPGGAADEFIELYNPSSVAITTNATWRLVTRDAPGSANCGSNTNRALWVGSGETIPSHGHLLIGGSGYSGSTTGDTEMTDFFSDGASVFLEHEADVVVDAVCFYFNQASQDNLTLCSTEYHCEGAPIMNPHDNTTGTNSDASLERKPGAAGGNATDTGVSSADFASISPSSPQNLASPATP